MPPIDRFDPGRFCWIELGTTDPAAAARFYGELFGWTAQESHAEGHGPYTMFRKGDHPAGGLYGLMKEQLDEGVPPHWMSYVAVESADAAVEAAGRLGGRVVVSPIDIPDVGRMAVLGDPTGAMFSVWQAGTHGGMGVVDEAGTPCWFELATRDTGKSGPFFTGLFGWESQVQPMGGTEYTMFRQGERSVGGMMQMTAEWGETPSHWMIYFQVDDCDATVARIGELGGAIQVPPTDIPGIGRFSLASDPQGAFFSVIRLGG